MALFLKYTGAKIRIPRGIFVMKNPVWSSNVKSSSRMLCGHFDLRFYSESRDTGNYESIEARTVEFSPSRSRDLSGETLRLHELTEDGRTSELPYSTTDDHFGSYDAHGSISLNSAMQSNVPEPFNVDGKRAPSHLNMPGGHVGQSHKYLSDHRNNAHYTRSVNPYDNVTLTQWRGYQSGKNVDEQNDVENDEKKPVIKRPKVGSKSRLKQAVKEYGSTVIVVHVCISLMSLGGFYLAVKSGVNVLALLEYFGLQATATKTGGYLAGASTFVIAYTVHKVFAPARIGITLAVTPYIVRQLRRMRVSRSRKKDE